MSPRSEDRLAAAVAQGHEDAVRNPVDFEEALAALPADNSLTPAPVSSPAGEDVERVRAEMFDWLEGRRSWTNLGPHEPYTPDVIAVMDAQEVVKRAAVLAALSARPVEAQEVERLRRDRNAWERLAHDKASEATAERTTARAALARAEALRAVLDDFAKHGTRFDLNPTVDGSEGAYIRYIHRIDESVRAKAARALLDGDSEGRES